MSEEHEHLGKLLGECRAGAIQRALYLICGIIALALGAGAFILLIHAFVVPSQEPVRPIKTTILGMVLLSAGGGMLLKFRSLLGVRVQAFADGLVRVQRGKSETLRWQDVETIMRVTETDEFTIATPNRLVLTTRQGSNWVLSESLSGLRELRQIIEDRTLPHMLPRAIQSVEDGKTRLFRGKVRAPWFLRLLQSAPTRYVSG